MPTTKRPHHCPGKKTQQLRGNCNVHAGFCKAHHVRCTVKEHYDVLFLYTEKCPSCDGGLKADQKKLNEPARVEQRRMEQRAAVGVTEASRTKGRNPLADMLKKK